MANRIATSIDRMGERLALIKPENKEKLEKGLKTSFEDLVAYQRLQSTAFACGKLSLEEAATLYNLYGEEVPTPEKFEKLTLAEKVVATQSAAELAKMNLCNVL